MHTHVEIKKIDPNAALPQYATPGSAGLDLVNNGPSKTLDPGDTLKVGTGIAIHIGKPNYAALILPRSGLGSKGIVLANTVGLIDSDYQGEIIVNLWNRAPYRITIGEGERIAQMMLVPVTQMMWVPVEEFTSDTERGVGGFGSTGKI